MVALFCVAIREIGRVGKDGPQTLAGRRRILLLFLGGIVLHKSVKLGTDDCKVLGFPWLKYAKEKARSVK